ncbi:hypothetical protein J18TS1_30050 [Oceanobacillus oncorhynchi subsp. incaldanensis]|uniref:DUF421 domain-containing protein n=2 Tax=Oceanobacillus TaxID=182709 RepID=A0A0A1MV94_9BACI|nr:DUF421 domain-containing protein [Oceanobacillus oncorhynchi]MDM8099694.1 DUF421 domain-containing protein [Oceanobacillus oncorhynchi]GIO19905.1 hypothetical protein J18TS1_30050 [Oceanobacillus oncorhynchi subsp. incaldanensis]CEI83357.1 hypothetical protein BN997_03264 [Oceanobacillus oncorhynchi]
MPEIVLVLIRSIAAFFLLFLMARMMGKKQISQLTFFDYCVGITIGSIAATLSVDQNVKIINGLVSLTIWGFFPIILAYLGMKSIIFSKITDGKATILIRNGEVLDKNMKKSLVTINELLMLLREKGTFKVSDVEMAVLETNGELSVMLKTNQQPVTPQTLGVPLEQEHGPAILIMDGKIMKKSLENLGYSKEWLIGEIQKQGAEEVRDVFLAQIDSRGSLYVDLYEDQYTKTEVEERPLLAASLKKIQADLEGFSLQTDDSEAKKLYTEQAAEVQKVLDTILPYLK